MTTERTLANGTKLRETGADELRRIVRVLGCSRESALDGFTSEQLIAIVRACWASGWDVYVDDLSSDQCRAILDVGEVPAFFESTRGLIAVPSSSCDSADVHDWLCGEHECDFGGSAEGLGACSAPINPDRWLVWRTAQRLRVAAAHTRALVLDRAREVLARDADTVLAVAVALASDFAADEGQCAECHGGVNKWGHTSLCSKRDGLAADGDA
jgi:hypothetical protein